MDEWFSIVERPATQSHEFSAGAFEHLRLTQWTRNGIGRVRLKGYVSIDCGRDSHRVRIDETVLAADVLSLTAQSCAETIVELVLADEFVGCSCDAEATL
jgi:allantoicase